MWWLQTQAVIGPFVCFLLVAPAATAQDAGNVDLRLLQTELELLKTQVRLLNLENEQLKKEVATLKQQLASPVGRAPEQADHDKPDAVLNGVEFRFVSLKREGTTSTLKVAVTSRDRDQRIPELVPVVLVTGNGRTFTGPSPSLRRSVTVRQGIRQIISYPLGALPEAMTEFQTIILPIGDNPSAARRNPARLNGRFQVR